MTKQEIINTIIKIEEEQRERALKYREFLGKEHPGYRRELHRWTVLNDLMNELGLNDYRY